MKKAFRVFAGMSLRAKLALFICLLFLLMAVFADQITAHPFNKISGGKFEPPSGDHWLGTNDLGMDLWAQMCNGARISLSFGLIVALIATALGGVVGLAAAFNRQMDSVLMALCNVFQSVPDIPIIIILASFFGQKNSVMILTLVIFSWTRPARLIRSRALVLKELPYVKVAKSYGAGFFHILREHLIWEIWPLWLVSLARLAGRAVVMEAAMAFLGLGDPTTKSWGMILNNALNYRGIYYTDYWKWWIVPPVLAIALLVTSLTVLVAELESHTGMRGGARNG